MMAGEVIRGGRQDRIFIEDMVIPPSDTPLMVRVHCVEKGRWSDVASTFSYGGRAEHALRSTLLAGADQQDTWAVVAALNAQRAHSPTGAYAAVGGPQWLAYRQQLRAQLGDREGVIGAVVAYGDRIVHAEIFADPQLATGGRGALLDGLARDALAMDVTAAAPDSAAAADYLRGALSGQGTLYLVDGE